MLLSAAMTRRPPPPPPPPQPPARPGTPVFVGGIYAPPPPPLHGRSDSSVPVTSLLREFIGGSAFDVH